jgi:hypothetical protein
VKWYVKSPIILKFELDPNTSFEVSTGVITEVVFLWAVNRCSLVSVMNYIGAEAGCLPI